MTAKEINETLKLIFKHINSEYDELSAKLSYWNNCTQDILHYFENEEYDDVTMTKLCRILKGVRIKRMEVKNELMQLQSIKDILGEKIEKINNWDADKFENRTYSNKTNIIDDYAEVCRTCKYRKWGNEHEEFNAFFCRNKDSEYCGCETEYDDTCENYELKDILDVISIKTRS